MIGFLKIERSKGHGDAERRLGSVLIRGLLRPPLFRIRVYACVPLEAISLRAKVQFRVTNMWGLEKVAGP